MALDLGGDRVERGVDRGGVVVAAARRADARDQRAPSPVEPNRPWQ